MRLIGTLRLGNDLFEIRSQEMSGFVHNINSVISYAEGMKPGAGNVSKLLLFVLLAAAGEHLRAETGVTKAAIAADATTRTASASSSSTATSTEPPAVVGGSVHPFVGPVSGFRGSPGALPTAASLRPFSAVGVGVHVGINGIGFDVATPVSPRFNIRTGMDFFNYTDDFTEQGANVEVKLQLRSAHANLDWFPFHNWFRISPMLLFANNNDVRATVLVPPGSAITLNGSDYISDPTDPLHGSGSVDFRKIAPGLTVGVGNLIPRSRTRHLSFPAELGFYYVGQPTLKVAFTGSACSASQPVSTGCQSVDTDQSFQKSLAAFIARNNHNLSYAKFFPVLSVGVGYSF